MAKIVATNTIQYQEKIVFRVSNRTRNDGTYQDSTGHHVLTPGKYFETDVRPLSSTVEVTVAKKIVKVPVSVTPVSVTSKKSK